MVQALQKNPSLTALNCEINLDQAVKFGQLTQVFLALVNGQTTTINPSPFYFNGLLQKMFTIYTNEMALETKLQLLIQEINFCKSKLAPFEDETPLDDLKLTVVSHRLWLALKNSQLNVLEDLIQGIDLNQQNEQGDLLLNIALKLDCSEAVVKLLVKYGANPTSTDANGHTAFHCTQQLSTWKLLGSDELIHPYRDSLIDHLINTVPFQNVVDPLRYLTNPLKPMEFAIYVPNERLIIYLLNNHFRVPTSDYGQLIQLIDLSPNKKELALALSPHLTNSWLPIHLFARVGLNDLLTEELNKNPGLINTLCSRHKETPLHLAGANGHITTSFLLLEKGANPSIRNIHGKFPAPYWLTIIYYRHKSPMDRYTAIMYRLNRFPNDDLKLLVSNAIARNV